MVYVGLCFVFIFECVACLGTIIAGIQVFNVLRIEPYWLGSFVSASLATKLYGRAMLQALYEIKIQMLFDAHESE